MPLTAEQIQEALSSDVGKAAIQKAVDTATEGLKTKNTELLGKIQKQNDRLDKFDGVDPDEYTRLKAEKADWVKQGTSSEESEKIISQMKKDHAREIQQRDEKITRLETSAESLMKSHALDHALAEVDVAPQYRRAVRLEMQDKLAITGEGDDRKVVIGDKSVTDAMKAFLATDEGKHYAAAPANSGGGSKGSGAGASGKNPFNLKDGGNLTEAAKAFRENPDVARQQAKEAGLEL